jgi:hypothetical protein
MLGLYPRPSAWEKSMFLSAEILSLSMSAGTLFQPPFLLVDSLGFFLPGYYIVTQSLYRTWLCFRSMEEMTTYAFRILCQGVIESNNSSANKSG